VVRSYGSVGPAYGDRRGRITKNDVSQFHPKENNLAIYSCPKCGMSVGTMTCGTCDKELVHDTLKLDDGRSVDIAKCPDGHGKVKSPQCCGEDMSCSV
tara:strand:- start:460 stop:753 length:294 start_codon:yes stop_codon:yes gene_type:complete